MLSNTTDTRTNGWESPEEKALFEGLVHGVLRANNEAKLARSQADYACWLAQMSLCYSSLTSALLVLSAAGVL